MDVEAYEKLKKFVMTNYKIKKEMVALRPPLDTDALSRDAIVKYTDNAYDSLRYIIRELKNMCNLYSDKNGILLNKVKELEKIWIKEFIKCKTNLDKLRLFYQYFITNMDNEIVEEVKISCVGYSHYLPTHAVKKSITTNEILHIIHSYVMSNERILKSLNVIKRKKLNNGYTVTLHGEENEIGMSILNHFPLDLDVGWVDIVPFNDINKIYMMVRDRGHALTIEIDYSEEDVLINYFVPKICDATIINRLPGINKVRENAHPSEQATGRFLTTKEHLNEDLYCLIEMVPLEESVEPKHTTSR